MKMALYGQKTADRCSRLLDLYFEGFPINKLLERFSSLVKVFNELNVLEKLDLFWKSFPEC